MLLNHNSCVARNVAGYFFLSFFIDEAAKAAHINIMATGHVRLNNIEKCLHGSGNICLVDSGFVCDLIDYVCFGHGGEVLVCGIDCPKNSGGQI